MKDNIILFPVSAERKTTKSSINTMSGRIVPFTRSQAEFDKYLEREKVNIPYKGYYIYIKYRENDYLIMSCLDRDLLIDIIPFGNKKMGSYIMTEYLMDKKEFEQLLTTVEWSSHPEIRRQELINGENVDGKIYNVKFYQKDEAKNIKAIEKNKEDNVIQFSNEESNVKTKRMAS